MRPSRKQEGPERNHHISYSGDRIAMRHAPLPDADLETLKHAVKIFSYTIRSAQHTELKCTFGDLAEAARKVYSKSGDPRTAECLRVLDMAHAMTIAADAGQPAVVDDKPKRGVVLVHPENGIYLGSCLGLGFWSKLDPVGQDAAVAFPSPGEALEYARSWDQDGAPEEERERFLSSLSCVEVEIDSPDGEPFASVQSCQRAGLDAWYNLDLMEPASPTAH